MKMFVINTPNSCLTLESILGTLYSILFPRTKVKNYAAGDLRVFFYYWWFFNVVE